MPQITPKHTLFIEALLTGKTVAEASETVGINTTTGYRWLRDPAVLLDLHQRRAAARSAAIDTLLAESRNAAEIIISIANNPNVKADVRLRAAESMLDRVTETAELDAMRLELAELREDLEALSRMRGKQ